MNNKNHDTEVLEPEVEETEEEEKSAEDIAFDADEATKDGDEAEESEESTEEETEEEESEEEETEPAPKQPKPVEGETARERGLRKEVERLKREKRESRTNEMFKKDESAPTTDEYDKLREEYSDEEILKMEKNFDIIAKKKGLTSQKTDPQDIFEDFMDDNPEYREGSEEGDNRFNLFEEKLNSGIYNLKGANKRQIKAIFRDIDKKVKDELGETETPRAKLNVKKRNATKQKIKSASHAGGTKVKKEKKPSQLDQADDNVKAMFKGDWDI